MKKNDDYFRLFSNILSLQKKSLESVDQRPKNPDTASRISTEMMGSQDCCPAGWYHSNPFSEMESWKCFSLFLKKAAGALQDTPILHRNGKQLGKQRLQRTAPNKALSAAGHQVTKSNFWPVFLRYCLPGRRGRPGVCTRAGRYEPGHELNTVSSCLPPFSQRNGAHLYRRFLRQPAARSRHAGQKSTEMQNSRGKRPCATALARLQMQKPRGR